MIVERKWKNVIIIDWEKTYTPIEIIELYNEKNPNDPITKDSMYKRIYNVRANDTIDDLLRNRTNKKKIDPNIFKTINNWEWLIRWYMSEAYKIHKKIFPDQCYTLSWFTNKYRKEWWNLYDFIYKPKPEDRKYKTRKYQYLYDYYEKSKVPDVQKCKFHCFLNKVVRNNTPPEKAIFKVK